MKSQLLVLLLTSAIVFTGYAQTNFVTGMVIAQEDSIPLSGVSVLQRTCTHRIHDSQHRVNAISLIHQKLYNTENVSSIDISLYIRELVTYLSDCFGTGQRIRFELNVEKLEMDVSQSVPLGLILNEAITNAIKYAFPNGRNGVISVSLVEKDREQIVLTICDDGIGMPHDFNTKRPGSLGMSLIRGLSEDLEGSLSIENNNGTTLKISFAHEPGVKRMENVNESLASSI